jgi:transposase
MSFFRAIDRKTPYLFPPSLGDWLPEDHLARFIVGVVEGLDLGGLEKAYAGRGSAAYHPALLLSLLVYGYSTGVFSSRGIERATYDLVAFRYMAAGSHPDHDTLASFRRRFLDELAGIFVQALELAREMKLLKLGTLSLDGAKIHANASRHSALSHGHIEKIEAQLKGEVEELLVLAEQADREAVSEGANLPAELGRREARLEALAAAKAKIEARARERFEREQAAYGALVASREARAEAQGKKPGGRPPKAPTPGARERDRINLADEESRIMPVAGGGFEQACNAQAAVDAESLLVVATELTQAPNDKEQVIPLLAQLAPLSESLGKTSRLLADTGYSSEKNIKACQAADIEPLIAIGRDQHHPGWRERFTEPDPLPEGAAPVARMAHRLKTKAGRAAYAQGNRRWSRYSASSNPFSDSANSSCADSIRSRANGAWSAWRGI